MKYVAILLTLAVAAMVIENKTPQQLLYSVLRETLKGLRYLRVSSPATERYLETRNPKPVHHSPYRKIRKNVEHIPLLLNLPTSENSGEAAHPDVLYVPEGWGRGNWPYLMSATPYPAGNDYFENPEFYVSHDGLRWTTPTGGGNPLVRVPTRSGRNDLKKEYHSDPSLLLNQGLLRLYYRWTGVFLDRRIENRLYVLSSRDGVEWSEPSVILDETKSASDARNFLSPSVLFLNGEYVMWTVEYEEGKRYVVRRTSLDGLRWSDPAKTRLQADYALPEPWHLDVAEDGGKLLLLLTAAGNRGEGAELHSGYSGDLGYSWTIIKRLIEPGYFFEEKRVYRSSLVPQNDGLHGLYYSSMSANGTWNIAYLPVGRENFGTPAYKV